MCIPLTDVVWLGSGGLTLTRVHHPGSFSSSVPDLKTAGQLEERTPAMVLIHAVVFLRYGMILFQFELMKAPMLSA